MTYTSYCTKCKNQTEHIKYVNKFYPYNFEECKNCGTYNKTVAIYITYGPDEILALRKD